MGTLSRKTSYQLESIHGWFVTMMSDSHINLTDSVNAISNLQGMSYFRTFRYPSFTQLKVHFMAIKRKITESFNICPKITEKWESSSFPHSGPILFKTKKQTIEIFCREASMKDLMLMRSNQ